MDSSDSCPRTTADGAKGGGCSVSNFQECHVSGESLPTTVHFSTLSSGETTMDRGVSPCDQPKRNKEISSDLDVQNGGFHTARSLPRKGDYMMKLDLKDARIAVSIYPGSRKYVSSFPVQGDKVQVPMPPLRPLPGSPSLHQNPPFDSGQTAFRRDTNSHLLGRSSPDSPSEGHIKRDLPLCAETASVS